MVPPKPHAARANCAQTKAHPCSDDSSSDEEVGHARGQYVRACTAMCRASVPRMHRPCRRCLFRTPKSSIRWSWSGFARTTKWVTHSLQCVRTWNTLNSGMVLCQTQLAKTAQEIEEKSGELAQVGSWPSFIWSLHVQCPTICASDAGATR